MAWPTVVVDTTNMDAAGDNPGNARAAIKQMADNVNAIKDAKGAASGVAPLDSSSLLPVANLPTSPATKGGTGQVSFAVGDLLYANSTTTLAKLPPGTTGHVITSNGAGAAPSYQAPTASVSDASTTVKGIVELATTAEATTGTDTVRAVTPAGLKAATDALVIGGMALLGTVNLSGGSTQSLSGLTLTGYKKLHMVIDALDVSIGADLRQNGDAIMALTGSGYCHGKLDVDLTTSIGESRLVIGASASLANPLTISPVLWKSDLTNASTSVTFTLSAGVYSAGTLYVYGVK